MCLYKVNKSLIHPLDLLPTFFLVKGKAIIKQKDSSKTASGQRFADCEAQVNKSLCRFLILSPWLHLSIVSHRVVLDSSGSHHNKVI